MHLQHDLRGPLRRRHVGLLRVGRQRPRLRVGLCEPLLSEVHERARSSPRVARVFR
jgi:hypothetical protein